MKGHYLVEGRETDRMLAYFTGRTPHDWHVWWHKEWRGSALVVDYLCPMLRSDFPSVGMKQVKSENLINFYKAIL